MPEMTLPFARSVLTCVTHHHCRVQWRAVLVQKEVVIVGLGIWGSGSSVLFCHESWGNVRNNYHSFSREWDRSIVVVVVIIIIISGREVVATVATVDLVVVRSKHQHCKDCLILYLRVVHFFFHKCCYHKYMYFNGKQQRIFTLNRVDKTTQCLEW